ncbi:hypothetical protein AAG570_005725 [Ranatra chinensis]|uniref:HTH OST-type domain-containing protein n=1 Tax=Ranatra chinensis TaxID=642074 RepID=A0ABD0Y0U6_9HEMI
MQSDGHFAATLKVPTLQDAQYAISRLHRRKIGMRRISISYAHTNQLQHDSQHLRWQIVSLLQEVPSYKLPLFKFMELFESRYTGTISVSDLGKLKDVCVIKTENNCRVVTLTADHRNTPSPNLAPHQEVEVYCSTHYKGIQSMDKGWAEQEALPLPNISEPLGQFSDNTHRLLASHNNTLPLSSFCDCYEAECGRLNITEAGVPLEHLIACVPRVEIAVVSGGIKYVRPAPPQKTYATDDPMADISKSVSPSLYHQLMQFGRELVDLLKTQPRCQLMFNRFIPAYHHHFGKQCRVADFGFTKLIDLLDTLPNMIHVIGNGKKRIITLSFSAQVRRFTADLLRVLKSQPFKRLELSELGDLFERTLGRPFEPMDYGLCRVEDLVAQLTESSLVVTKSPADGSITSISVSPHVQTTEEMELTKVFAREVIELLSHASQCCILFNKFIPAYHHHFGHQCRVADFGFTKLIELFEAIPDVVKIEKNAEGEREVTLMPRLKLEVLNEQVCKLASARYPPGLPLKSLPAAFLWQYGYTLRPENYQAADMDELMTKITTVKVENLDCGPTLIPIDEAQIHQLSSQIRLLLMNSADGSAPLAKLQASFPKCYRHHLTQERLANYMADIVEIEERNGKKVVTLNRLNLFTRNLYRLLLKQSGCRLPVKLLETAYQWEYSERVKPEDFGKQSVGALLASITHTVTLRGKGSRRMVALNRDMVNGKISVAFIKFSLIFLWSKWCPGFIIFFGIFPFWIWKKNEDVPYETPGLSFFGVFQTFGAWTPSSTRGSLKMAFKCRNTFDKDNEREMT